MWRPALLTLLLAAAAAGGDLHFNRNGCGCLRNPVAGPLTAAELAQVRKYIGGLGVKHVGSLTDQALEAVFRFNLLNNFPGVVPSNRAGVIEVILRGLRELSDSVVPSQKQVDEVVTYLGGNVPELAAGKVQLDLPSLVGSGAVVLHQRGVGISQQQLGLVLGNGLSGYLQSPAYKVDYNGQSQLVATLDSIDHAIPSILELEQLKPVRAKLESRFNLDSKIFDSRFRQSVESFERNRQRILDSFNTLASRGAGFEVSIQTVISKVVELFPGLSSASARTILNILQLTNSAGGRARPRNLISMIAIPPIDPSLRVITDVVVNRFQLHMPDKVGLSAVQVREAYALFIVGLASQGITPLRLDETHASFIFHTQRFFLASSVFTPEAYILYVIRVVVPSIPRGSPAFSIRLFDPTIVVDEVLVPEPLRSIYEEGRKTIIPRVFGIQGNSIQITRRLAQGEGDKPPVENPVVLRPPIVNGRLPTAKPFSYGGVALSGVQFQTVSAVLSSRFGALSARSLQEPILQALIEAGVVSGTGDAAAAALSRLFTGLPSFTAPGDLSPLVAELRRLKLTQEQLLAGLQQFFVTTRSLGHIIPAGALPGVFSASVRRFIDTVPRPPKQPFNVDYLRYLRRRLPAIIERTVLVGNSVPVLGDQLDDIFSTLGSLRISRRAQRTIVRFIDSSKLVRGPFQGAGQAVSAFRKVLGGLASRYPRGLFGVGAGELGPLRAALGRYGPAVSDQQLRDANAIATVGLGLFNRIDAGLKPAGLHQLLRRAILSFLRINKASNIPSADFIRAVYGAQQAPLPTLPVPVPDPHQEPRPPTVPPIPIIDDILLPVADVDRVISLLRGRFPFVSFDNVQPILQHVVLARRAAGVSITAGNLLGQLTSFVSSLPADLAVSALDVEALRKAIDGSIHDATVTGNGIQAGVVQLLISMHGLALPLPKGADRDSFFTFVIVQFARTVRRQQLRFGAPYHAFLGGFLPKLTGLVRPYPLFSAPQLFSLFEKQLSPTLLRIDDLPLLIQAVTAATSKAGGPYSLQRLVKIVSGLRAAPAGLSALTDTEVSSVLTQLSAAQLSGVTGPQVRRAFGVCRLAARLAGGRLAGYRPTLLRLFSQLVVTTVRQHKGLLVPQLVPGLVGILRGGGAGPVNGFITKG
nr:CP100k-like protein 1 [Capitulum mitella]